MGRESSFFDKTFLDDDIASFMGHKRLCNISYFITQMFALLVFCWQNMPVSLMNCWLKKFRWWQISKVNFFVVYF